MSVIKKKPFIEKVYESLSDAQKTTLGNQINASGNTLVHKTISQVESGIHTYMLKLNEFLVVPCICIKTDDYEVALGYGNKQIINIYNLDTEIGSYTEIKEHCSIEELRRIVFGTGGGGGGGEIDPAELATKMEGSTEVSVDLNASGTKVKVDLHAKRVDITAPETATSGTLTDADLAALHESYGSYIVFNREKYYFNDNAHVSGFLGYTHVGYENSKFILKNITVTENTKGWVLNTEEIGGGVAGVDFAITLVPLNPQLTAFQITSNNFAEEIADYVETHGKMPKVAGIVVAGDDKYLCLGTQIDVEDDGVVYIGVTRNQWYSNVKEELHFSIEMEPGHSGTTAGQSVSCDTDKLALSFHEKYTDTTEVSGVTVPELTVDQVRKLSAKMIDGVVCVIKNDGDNTGYKVVTAKPYKTYDVAIQIRHEDKDVIYYIDESGAEVQVGIDVLSSTGGTKLYQHEITFTCTEGGSTQLILRFVNKYPSPYSTFLGIVAIECVWMLERSYGGTWYKYLDLVTTGPALGNYEGYYVDNASLSIKKETLSSVNIVEDVVTEY